jgi:hypothetical protein
MDHPGRSGSSRKLAMRLNSIGMSPFGPFRTWRDVCYESVMRGKADIGQRAGMATGWAR